MKKNMNAPLVNPQLYKLIGLAVISIFLSAGCTMQRLGGYNTVQLENSKRMAIVWKLDEKAENEKKRKVHICLESVGPASLLEHALTEITLKGGVSPKGVSVATAEVSFKREITESLAKIYDVSETLQFAHGTLFRLCEIRGNGDISQQGYEELFQWILEATYNVILAKSEQYKLQDQITYLKNQLENEKKEKEGTVKERDSLEKELTHVKEKLEQQEKQAKIDELNSKISDYERKINELNSELKKVEPIYSIYSIPEPPGTEQREEQQAP